MVKSFSAPPWQRTLVMQASVVIGVCIIGVLYWAQSILIPVALAIFLTFLLAPCIQVLQRRGLGRITAVLVVVLTATLLLGGILWLVSHQLSALMDELPNYTNNLKLKAKSLRESVEGSAWDRLQWMLQEIGVELERSNPGSKGLAQPQPLPAAPVFIQPSATSLPAWLQGLVSPMFEIMGQLALAALLVIFMLFAREDMRDRLLRIVGHGRITLTTKVLDDAATRISRFLLMQAIVNGTYGLVLALGLLLIGVDYALLWGFLAALLRYVPYIGAWIAAVLPIGLCLAMFESWTQPLLVIGFFVILELVSNNVMEPWLYGQSIGVSEIAFIVAAAFWAFLWGPIGLVLSAPLTVCLVVLGKFVPQLEFLDILLGDQPVFAPDVRYYQRALARDEDEATEVVLDQLKETSLEQVFDELLLPALTYARRDRGRDNITEADESYLRWVTREVVDDLGQKALQQLNAQANAAEAEPDIPPVHVLGYAARDESEEAALTMLQQLLPPTRWDLEIAPAKLMASELLTRVEASAPAVICLASLPPGGLAHTRYLCKRLRARFPALKIVVGRWGLEGNMEHFQESLREAGADWVCASLQETRDLLTSWLPVLAAQAPDETLSLVEAG